MTLGDKIRQLREERGLSQEELAERLDVSRQTVSNWENDKATPDAIKLGMLCRTFGVSADELLALPVSAEEREGGTKGAGGKSGLSKWAVPLIAAAVFAVIAVVGLILCATGVIPARDRGHDFEHQTRLARRRRRKCENRLLRKGARQEKGALRACGGVQGARD